MRILSFLPFQEGYEPISFESNQELGVLDIFHPSEETLLEESKMVPEVLILRCNLKPIPMVHTSTQAQLILEGEALKSIPLYRKGSIAYGYDREGESSHWQGIALNYLGTGQGSYHGEKFTFQGTTLPMGEIACENPFYIKPFCVETQNHQERQTTLISQQLLTSPPGILNVRVLRGYGGYYKPGIALEEIQQIYYSLSAIQSDTRIRLYTSSQLKLNLTPPPLGGKGIAFHPPPKEEEFLSLSGALAAGYAHIDVITEFNTVTFHSYLGETIADAPPQLNVYFKA